MREQDGIGVSFRPRERKDMTDWPRGRTQNNFGGAAVDPRAGDSYHLPRIVAAKRSEVQSEAAVCWTHKLLCLTPRLAVQYDRLDATIVASQELVSRRLVMIERAAVLNPQAPSSARLHNMIDHALSEEVA